MADPDVLHVVGRTADGRIWYTRRRPTGWSGFEDLTPHVLTATAVDVACTYRMQWPTAAQTGLLVLVAMSQEPPRLLFRPDGSGSWSSLPSRLDEGRFPVSRRAGVVLSQDSAADPIRHMAVVTDAGRLLASKYPDNAPNFNVEGTQGGDVEAIAGQRGDARSAALYHLGPFPVPFSPPVTGSRSGLFAAFSDGRLFHTTGNSGLWSPFVAFTAAPPNGPGAQPGDIVDVSATRVFGTTSSHVVVAVCTGGGGVYWAIQDATGWSSWSNMEVSLPFLPNLPDVGTFARVPWEVPVKACTPSA